MKKFMMIVSGFLAVLAPLQFLITILVIAFLASSRDMKPVFWTSFGTMIILGICSLSVGLNCNAFSD